METGNAGAGEREVLDLRPANDWMKAGGERPRMLFGDLWKTGELCVMFGEAGVGKSLLAVQIADSIAKGRGVEPFGFDGGARRVLYVDLEKTASQFAERYTEPDADRAGRRRRHNFSKRFDRVAPLDGGYVRAAEIGRRIGSSGATVVVIDNLAHMLRGGLPREAAAAMRELRRMRTAYGVSILVVAGAGRSTMRGGITAADMAWARTVAPLADNIFAVGRCRSGGRYVKHLTPNTSPAEGAPGEAARFRIERVNGTSPSFVFEGFGAEADVQRAGGGDERERELMERILRMSEEQKLSVRDIADEIGMPKSTVHRHLQAARMSAAAAEPQPAPVPAPKVFYALDACIDRLCSGCDFCGGRPGNINRTVSGAVFGHGDCPDDCDICGPRIYRSEDAIEPEVRRRSDEFFVKLRAWLHDGKTGARPIYEDARRYGAELAAWYPGSENWPEEKLQAFDSIRRKTGSLDRALWEAERMSGSS